MYRQQQPVVMLNLAQGYWVSRLVNVAATLGIADLLRDGSKTVDDLASATGVHTPALHRVMRALASVGVFEETDSKVFQLTPLADTLRTDVPGSMRAIARFMSEDYWFDEWNELGYSVRTGERAFPKAHGVQFFEFLERHPDRLQVFGEAMTSISAMQIPAIVAAYDFSVFQDVIDLGGGHVSLLAGILRANPKVDGVLFDLPSVIERARQDTHVTAPGVAERCTLAAGDWFESVPAGADAYVTKGCIHDWDDEDAVRILANFRAAMNGTSKVLVIDNVIQPGNEPAWGKLLDIEMLVIGGLERTEQEFASLFARAGLKLSRVVPTACPLSIVEGVRA